MDLTTLLQLLPNAIAWAQFQADHIAALGVPLPENLAAVAHRVGVRKPELIRVKRVDHIPLPGDALLRRAAHRAGLLGPETLGLTLGYGIFIVSGHDTVRLLSHEFRHVYQYETLGSIDKFLPVYLQQIVDFGYADAPLEVDAREYEMLSA